MTPGLKLLSGIGRFLLFLGLLPIAFANELSSTIDVLYVAVNVNIPYGVQVRQEQLFGLTGQRLGERIIQDQWSSSPLAPPILGVCATKSL